MTSNIFYLFTNIIELLQDISSAYQHTSVIPLRIKFYLLVIFFALYNIRLLFKVVAKLEMLKQIHAVQGIMLLQDQQVMMTQGKTPIFDSHYSHCLP